MQTSLILLAIGIVGGLLFGIFRSRLSQSRLLDASARREKHAPKAAEIPTQIPASGNQIQKSDKRNQPAVLEENKGPTLLESSSRQIDELSIEEREEYNVRDQARDQNIANLRLLVEDLFDDEDDSIGEVGTDLEKEQSSIELRRTWIEQYEQPLNEHAAFIEKEEVGSGIKILDSSVLEHDDIQSRLEREGGKNGEVQVSLAWDDFNDLDLHLFCPSGERIYFNNKKSACGGELDVDMNVRPTSENAVENIVWIENAPLGQYKVGVHFYKHHSKNETLQTCEFRARIIVHGEVRDYS